jgi:hypothetical protein
MFDFNYLMQIILSGAATLYVFNTIFYSMVPAWSNKDRGFVLNPDEWKQVFVNSTIISAVFSLTSWVVSGYNFTIFLLSLVLSYSLTFSSITDIRVHKAPKEVANYSIVFATVVTGLSIFLSYLEGYYTNIIAHVNNSYYNIFPFVYNVASVSLLNIFVWFLFIAVIMLVSRGGLGMADVRLFVLLGVTIVWWVGLGNFLFIFGAMNILQALMFIPAHYLNWGEMVAVPSGKKKRAIPFIPVISTVALTSFLVMLFFTVLA